MCHVTSTFRFTAWRSRLLTFSLHIWISPTLLRVPPLFRADWRANQKKNNQLHLGKLQSHSAEKNLENVSTNKPFVIQNLNLNLTVVKMLTEFHPTEIYNAHITPCAMYTVNRGMKKIIECCNLIKSMIQTRMMDDRWLNPFTFKMELKTLFFNYLLEETFSALFVNISTKCCINYFKKITLKLFNKFGIVSEIHEWKRAFFAFNNIKKSSLWMLNFCKKKQNWNSQLKIQMNGIQRDFLFNWFKCNKSNYFILLLNVFVFKELFRTIK